MTLDKKKVNLETTLVLTTKFARSGGRINFKFPSGYKEIRIPPLTQEGAKIFVQGGGYLPESKNHSKGDAYLTVRIQDPQPYTKSKSSSPSESLKPSSSNRSYNNLILFLAFLVPCILVSGGLMYGEYLLTAVRYRAQPPAPVEQVVYPADQREFDLNILRAKLYEQHRNPSDPQYQRAQKEASLAQGLNPASVGLLVGYDAMSITSLCSATALTREKVLTAASCLRGMMDQPIDRLYFLTDAESAVRFNGHRIEVTHAVTPENMSMSDGSDLALLTIFSNGRQISQVRSLKEGFANNLSVGGKVTLIGYESPFNNSRYRKTQRDCVIKESNSALLQVGCTAGYGMKGAGVFALDAQARRYYLAGIISNIDSSGSLIAHIPPGRREDLNTLVTMNQTANELSKQLRETWTTKPFQPNKNLNILIRNNCSMDIGAAMVFREINGAWVARGFRRVPPGETHEVARSDNNVYWLHVRTFSTRREMISGNFEYEVPGSGKFGFIKAKSAHYGDALHEVSAC